MVFRVDAPVPPSTAVSPTTNTPTTSQSPTTTSSSSMSLSLSPSGTYSALLAIVPLPLPLLAHLLPPSILPLLLPPPSHLQARFPPNTHPVLLQLGRQQRCGVSVMRQSFQEAKFEVPFVLHPESPAAPGSGVPAREDVPRVPFVYKHSVAASTYLISVPARFITGINAARAEFSPSDAPVSFANTTGEEMKYEIVGKLKWVGTEVGEKGKGKARVEGLTWEEVRAITEMWWYGERMGSKVTRFAFSPPTHPPKLYTSSLRLHLPSFSLNSSPDLNPLASIEGIMLEPGGWIQVHGVQTWWAERSWEMVGPRDVGEVELELESGLGAGALEGEERIG